MPCSGNSWKPGLYELKSNHREFCNAEIPKHSLVSHDNQAVLAGLGQTHSSVNGVSKCIHNELYLHIDAVVPWSGQKRRSWLAPNKNFRPCKEIESALEDWNETMRCSGVIFSLVELI